MEQLCIYNVTLGTDRESRKRHQYIEFVFSLSLSAPLVGQERVTNPKKRLRGRLPVLIICHFNVSFPRAKLKETAFKENRASEKANNHAERTTFICKASQDTT